MEQPKAIHFATSHLHWITSSEASHGWFLLDAFLEWSPKGHQQPLPFVLGAAVAAGRMYAPSGPLLKQPPYSFQLIAGHLEHTIQRRALDHKQPYVPSDSTQPHNQTFIALSWELSSCLARPLKLEDLATIPHPPPTLNILVELEHDEGFLRLQAPLRHWNHRSHPSGWQLETGPVLWPLDLEAFTAEPNTSWLTPAWIHSNHAGRVTMSSDRLPCHELEAQLSLLALT